MNICCLGFCSVQISTQFSWYRMIRTFLFHVLMNFLIWMASHSFFKCHLFSGRCQYWSHLTALLLLALFRVNMIHILLHRFLNKSSSKKPLLPSLKEWTLLSWRSAELWRIRGVTEWVHNGPKSFILTYWQLFSWKASPRESDPTERNCPAGGTSWDTVNGTWERELKLVQHGDVWMEYQICVIDNSEASEMGAIILFFVSGTEN